MIRRVNFLIILALFVITSCNRGKEITFYLTNNSPFTKDNIIRIYINDTILIDQNFKYSNVVPNDEVFKFRLKKHILKLKAVELTYGLEKVDSIDIDKDRHIFISFNEFKKDTHSGDTIKRQINILKMEKLTKLY